MMVSRNKLHDITTNPGYTAMRNNTLSGLITYNIEDQECEITSLNSLEEGIGIGTSLVEAVRNKAREAGCSRLFVITTNDNTHALRFYQKYGFTIAAIYIDSMNNARQLKPEIPFLGNDNIMIRDEIELEFMF